MMTAAALIGLVLMHAAWFIRVCEEGEMYNVHFRRFFEKPAEITSFETAKAALGHAIQYFSAPYYQIRIEDTETREWLTYAQLAHRLESAP